MRAWRGLHRHRSILGESASEASWSAQWPRPSTPTGTNNDHKRVAESYNPPILLTFLQRRTPCGFLSFNCQQKNNKKRGTRKGRKIPLIPFGLASDAEVPRMCALNSGLFWLLRLFWSERKANHFLKRQSGLAIGTHCSDWFRSGLKR